jgi:hypothetical protein
MVTYPLDSEIKILNINKIMYVHIDTISRIRNSNELQWIQTHKITTYIKDYVGFLADKIGNILHEMYTFTYTLYKLLVKEYQEGSVIIIIHSLLLNHEKITGIFKVIFWQM